MKRSAVIASLIAGCVGAALAAALATGFGLIRLENIGPVTGAVLVGIGTAFALALIMLWVGIGVYVYRDARARGMEPVLWTVVAMLIPYFVGLVVYLIVRQTRSGSCPRCGRGVPADAAFCQHCGAPLRSGCPSCGRLMTPGAAYCPSCGASVGSGGGAPQAT